MNSYNTQFNSTDKQFSHDIMRLSQASHIALLLYDRNTPQQPISFLFNDGISELLADNYTKRVCQHDPLLPHAGTPNSDAIRRTEITTRKKLVQLADATYSDTLYQDVLAHAGYKETAAFSHRVSSNLHLVVGLLLSNKARNGRHLQLDAASQLTEEWLSVCADNLIDSSIRHHLYHNSTKLPQPQNGFNETAINRGDFGLSQREADVVGELIKGKSNKQISAALTLSEYTVENYLRKIYKKFNVHSRTELISVLAHTAR